jgi:HNH endonuclease
VSNTGRVKLQHPWFVEGAAALGRTLTAMGLADAPLPTGEFYACPCCLMAYGPDALDAGVFTAEHVPPQAVGGRKLVLTCQDCNHSAGSAFDAHAERREAMFDLLTGRAPCRPVRGEFAVDDTTTILRGNIHRAGDGFLMVGVPEANDPKVVEEVVRALERKAANGTGGRIGLRLTETMLPVRAQLSWVRAAYLAAFAALGWRYVFVKYLKPLRAQLADPTAELLPPLAMVNLTAPQDRRQMLLVREPHELRSLAVVLGRYTVYLPGLEDPQPFEDLSAALARLSAQKPPRPQLVGGQIPWPTEPRYALDQ